MMDGWEKLIDAATQTTLVTIERARQLEEHRRRTQDKDTDLSIEQLRDSVDEFDHAAELVEEIGWEDPWRALQEHKKQCNRCFQGIFCPEKHRLLIEINDRGG